MQTQGRPSGFAGSALFCLRERIKHFSFFILYKQNSLRKRKPQWNFKKIYHADIDNTSTFTILKSKMDGF